MRQAIILSAVVALAACSRDEAPAAGKALNCAASEGGKVEASGAWVRAQSDPQGTSAAYFTLCNGGAAPATLAGIATGFAGKVELHESTRDAAGVVSMGPIGAVTLEPGERVVFEPGGKHAMLFDLADDIDADDQGVLTLQFADGSSLDVKAEARSMTEAAAHEGR